MEEYAYDESLVGAEVRPGYTVVAMVVMEGLIGSGREDWCFRIESAAKQNNFWAYEVRIDAHAEPTLTGHRAKVTRHEVRKGFLQVGFGAWGQVNYGASSHWKRSIIEPKTHENLEPGDLVVANSEGRKLPSLRDFPARNEGVCEVIGKGDAFPWRVRPLHREDCVAVEDSEIDVLRGLPKGEPLKVGDIVRLDWSPYTTRPAGSFVKVNDLDGDCFRFAGGKSGGLDLWFNRGNEHTAYRPVPFAAPAVKPEPKPEPKPELKYKVGDEVEISDGYTMFDDLKGNALTIVRVSAERGVYYVTGKGVCVERLPLYEYEIKPHVKPELKPKPELEYKVGDYVRLTRHAAQMIGSPMARVTGVNPNERYSYRVKDFPIAADEIEGLAIPAFVHVQGENGGTILIHHIGDIYDECSSNNHLVGRHTLEQVLTAIEDHPDEFKAISCL